MQTRAPLAPVARCRPGGGRCGPGPAAARLGLPGLRCGARGTARQVQLTDCAWLARTERCNRGAVHSCTGGVGQEQAVWAWARRCAAEGRPRDASRRRLRATNRACPSHTPAAAGVLQLSACAGCARRERAPRARARRCAPGGRPGVPASAQSRRLTATNHASLLPTHSHPPAGHDITRGPRVACASGARAQGASQALRAWKRPGAPASAQSRRQGATNRAFPPAHTHSHPPARRVITLDPRGACASGARAKGASQAVCTWGGPGPTWERPEPPPNRN